MATRLWQKWGSKQRPQKYRHPVITKSRLMSGFGRATVRTNLLDQLWLILVRATRLWQEQGTNQKPRAQKYADYTTAPPLLKIIRFYPLKFRVTFNSKTKNQNISWEDDFLFTKQEEKNRPSVFNNSYVFYESHFHTPQTNKHMNHLVWRIISISISFSFEQLYNNKEPSFICLNTIRYLWVFFNKKLFGFLELQEGEGFKTSIRAPILLPPLKLISIFPLSFSLRFLKYFINIFYKSIFKTIPLNF